MQSPSETVAVVDVGSNSIKLLVARAGPSPGSIETVFAETVETRISGGIGGAVPRLSDHAFASGIRTISDLLELARAYDPADTCVVATSAVRDAINGREFVDAVRAATGQEVRILSGNDEARLIGKGLAADPNLAGVRDFIQMDLGGGSLELIGFRKERIDTVVSLPLGAVRVSERYLEDREGPLPETVRSRIRAHVRETVEASGFGFTPRDAPLIATGGAFTVSRAVLAARAGVTIADRTAVLHRSELNELAIEFCVISLHERLKVGHLPAARADIIPAALLTIDEVLDISGRSQLTHSFYNLRYGIAAERLHG